MRAILGISFGHGDSSAALIKDGVLVAAVEEERLTRIKHDARFPKNAVRYCLAYAGVLPSQVSAVAIARRPSSAWLQRLTLLLKNPRFFRFQSRSPINVDEGFSQLGLAHAKKIRVEHHLAHLHSVRAMTHSKTLSLFSFDGLGDFTSACFAFARGNEIEVFRREYFPHSVGFFYTALTQYLGFPYFGDEFKVMGLSSYGSPRFLVPMRELLETSEKGFRLNLKAFPVVKHPPRFEIKNSQPSISPFFDEKVLSAILKVPRRHPQEPIQEVHHDLAASLQKRFEEVGNHCLNLLFEKTKQPEIGLSGGCAHNSVWVGQIPKSTPFKTIHVAPASHDAGIAVGAAVGVYGGQVNVEGGHWGLLGPSAEPSLSNSWDEKVEAQTLERTPLINWMADALASGKILGLVDGRLEFGPRALGSRSILADPRPQNQRDRLNLRVKHREAFRPFAASVLWEHQAEWFENSFYCPSMEAVFKVREERRSQIPAVVHVDQTCRIQSVRQETQTFYWHLIEAFRKRTGIPMLVNTSFNDSEPIVCNAEDALRCFLNTDLDALVIGNRVFTKNTKRLSQAS